MIEEKKTIKVPVSAYFAIESFEGTIEEFVEKIERELSSIQLQSGATHVSYWPGYESADVYFHKFREETDAELSKRLSRQLSAAERARKKAEEKEVRERARLAELKAKYEK